MSVRTGHSTPPQPTVYVVDDDPGVRESLCLLFTSAELRTVSYGGAVAFLAGYDPSRPGCAILDLELPGMSGLELQERLVAAGSRIPIIMISGSDDLRSAVRAIRLGALDFIRKPVDGQHLLNRVREGLEQDTRDRRRRAVRLAINARVASLTPREREVLSMVIAGTPNKNIATALGRSRKTVEIHRANMMRKMGASCVAELVHLAHVAGLLDDGILSPALALHAGLAVENAGEPVSASVRFLGPRYRRTGDKAITERQSDEVAVDGASRLTRTLTARAATKANGRL
ncbi:MAG: response regulator transcription factor [Phycisphaerae bacterium]